MAVKILYQGTGAAEGIPALFCRCPVCANARLKGGREIRTRAGALIDGRIKLDFGPDSFMQMINGGIDYAALHTLLATHTHADHFDIAQLALRRNAFAHFDGESPLMSVYGNAETGALIRKNPNENIRFSQLNAYEPREIAGYTITALDAVHCLSGGGKNAVTCRGKTVFRSEQAFIYLIDKDGKSLLYAHDTDMFCDEAIDYLKGKRLSFISLDCSNGTKNAPFTGHMGITGALKMREKLLECGAADESTIFAASHFCHNGYTDCEDMAVRLKGIIPAYDGLEVEF